MGIRKIVAPSLLLLFGLRVSAFAAPVQSQDGYRGISFDQLGGYEYDLPEDGRRPRTGQIPEDVTSLNGQKVVMRGYGMPIAMDEQGIKTFALLKDMASCCFGMSPKINHWVYVTMTKKSLTSMDMSPMKVFGTLEVGEEFEDGELLSLYRLKADRVEQGK